MSAARPAVLLMAYGGPDSLDDVEAYLLDIRGGRPTAPELVAEIRARYAQIGGRSPLLAITRAQAAELERCLNDLAPAADSQPGYRVYVGMRHWKPTIRDAVAQIARDGNARAIALVMAPHASEMSSGAYLKKLHEAQEQVDGVPHFDFIESWYDQPFLIRALAEKVRAAASQFPAGARVHYLFTAHSLPASLKERGDPYADQLAETTRLVVQELGLPECSWSFAYQSAGSIPGQWLGPSIDEVLPQLAEWGVRDVLVTPVGFLSEHVEILYDLDIEAQRTARENGLTLVRSQALNATPSFIEGLAKFILERETALQ